MEDSLCFKNGKFKIMQIADVQEKASVNPDTLKLITLALKREKPDLVIFTGDQIMGYSASFKRDTRQKVENTIKTITAPVSQSKTPFCITFGNHDRDCKISNKVQMNEIYKNLPFFICGKPHNTDDCATYSLQIKNSNQTKNIFNLYVIDSGAKEKDGTYSPVKTQQVEWYKNERERLKDENGNYLPSLVFQHIPLPEFYKAIKRCSRFKKGAVEAFNQHKNEFYVLDNETLKNGGFMRESPAVPKINNGEFAAMKEKGDVLGVFVGHDHINSFVKDVDCVKLGYTQGCGFNTYGPGKDRGVRVFVLDENQPKSFETYTVTMRDLCNDKLHKPAMAFLLSHAPSSVNQVKSIAANAVVCAAASFCVGFAAKRILSKR